MDTQDKLIGELKTWSRFKYSGLRGVVVYQMPHETDVILAQTETELTKKQNEYLDAGCIEILNDDLIETLQSDTVVQVTVNNPYMVELPLMV